MISIINPDHTVTWRLGKHTPDGSSLGAKPENGPWCKVEIGKMHRLSAKERKQGVSFPSLKPQMEVPGYRIQLVSPSPSEQSEQDSSGEGDFSDSWERGPFVKEFTDRID